MTELIAIWVSFLVAVASLFRFSNGEFPHQPECFMCHKTTCDQCPSYRR